VLQFSRETHGGARGGFRGGGKRGRKEGEKRRGGPLPFLLFTADRSAQIEIEPFGSRHKKEKEKGKKREGSSTPIRCSCSLRAASQLDRVGLEPAWGATRE